MQEYIPVILAGLLTACAPARPGDDREVAMREVRVAQIAAASGYQQQKRDTSHPPKVQFTPPPPPKSATEVERDKLDGKPVVKFAPPVVKKDEPGSFRAKKSPATGEQKQEMAFDRDLSDGMTKTVAPGAVQITDKNGKSRVFDENGKDITDKVAPLPLPQKKKSAVKKVKVNEATGEVRLYDANNKDITGEISPRTKKVRFVKDASGGGKVLDENGKEVKDIPPPPPPVQFKKPAVQPASGKKVSGIADPNDEHNREIPPPPPPQPAKKGTPAA